MAFYCNSETYVTILTRKTKSIQGMSMKEKNIRKILFKILSSFKAIDFFFKGYVENRQTFFSYFTT